MTPPVSVCVPSLPERVAQRDRALRSVGNQTMSTVVAVALDWMGQGPAATRNRALAEADTEWVAFLDDDDELLPDHVAALYRAALDTAADLVFPWFWVQYDTPTAPAGLLPIDPFPAEMARHGVDGGAYRQPFNAARRSLIVDMRCNFIPVSVLARREVVMDMGGFPEPNSDRWPHPQNEDWGLWRDLLNAGAHFAHHPERTWIWTWHQGNTGPKATR